MTITDKKYNNCFEDYEIEEKSNYKFDNNYVKINGNLDPRDFMSELKYELDKDYIISQIIGEIKLIVKKQYDEDDEEEEEEDNHEIEEKLNELGIDYKKFKKNFTKKDLIIEIKIFRLDKDTHLITFKKISGEIEDYYKNIKEIIEKIGELLK